MDCKKRAKLFLRQKVQPRGFFVVAVGGHAKAAFFVQNNYVVVSVN